MVKYITYKTRQLPVRLSYRAIKGMQKEGASFKKNVETMEPEFLETMLYLGLVSGHKAEDKELPYKKEDMEDILDECLMEFLGLIKEFFPKAKLGNVVPDLENNLPQETAASSEAARTTGMTT
jgi:hypothetical protein